MHPTRQEIKAWLKDSPASAGSGPRDRAWLGRECGVAKRTVDNWLSATNQEIPAAALALIARLMADDRAAPSLPQGPQRPISQSPSQPFLIEVDLDTFRGYNRAALARGLTIEDWIIRTCDDEVAAMDAVIPMAAITTTRLPSNKIGKGEHRTSKGTAEAPAAHWLDLHGGIAAGAPIAADLAPQPIAVPRAYPDGHYALRVYGQSMAPRIPDGATIIVAPFQGKGSPRKGSIVIYNDGHGATLKELAYRKAKPGEEGNSFNQVPILKSLNPAFKEVQTMEGGRIDGVLVEVV
jgi:SOS-response transcriptional repressor LexA